MHPALILLFALTALIGTAVLTAFSGSYRRLHLQDPNYEVPDKEFFYRSLHLYFFPEFEYEGLLFSSISALHATRFAYALLSLLFLSSVGYFQEQPGSVYPITYLWMALILLGFVFALLFFGDFIPRIVGARQPDAVIRFCGPMASVLMAAAFPITFSVLKLSRSRFQDISFEEPLTRTKREIIEIIQRTHVGPELNLHEKKLIEYVLRFKDRIAREVMVPRVDVFSLSAETPIAEAASLIKEEGYSRIPIYRNSVDNIVGVLMYKDILSEYMKYESSGNDRSIIEAPIEKIQKSVLYTPETQKISNLLLEFRKKQVHLAIVVDEYGGTEGIVTIEDILEEIVGEIEDEYDEEEDMFFPQADGSWIVDARMSIFDIEQQLGILIPQEGDYDTVGGFIFHCAGTIPPKGFVIHKEEFEMEILRSDERRVERVRLKPVVQSEDELAEGAAEREGGGEE